MVNSQIIQLLQDTANSFTQSTGANYKAIYNGYSCIIHDEIDFQFRKGTPMLIEASVVFGSATKNNDLEDKYNMNFVVNIQSEVNGYEIAKSLFNDIFKILTRQVKQLGEYSGKIFLTSPVLMNPYAEIEDSFCSLFTMNGSVEFSEKLVIGCKYQLSLDGTNYIDIKPRQPYCLKEATGGNDKNMSNVSIMTFTKESNVLTINIVVLYEKITGSNLTTAQTNFNTLMDKLYDECFGSSTQTYYLKIQAGTTTAKSFSKLICVRGQHIYDEATGENVLSLQFKVGE